MTSIFALSTGLNIVHLDSAFYFALLSNALAAGGLVPYSEDWEAQQSAICDDV